MDMTEELVKRMFDNFLNDEISLKSSQLLYLLIKKEILSIKVAKPLGNKGMFHDKIGIFYDNYNNMIAISGSNNETISALKYNTESFDIFKSWVPSINEYVHRHKDEFNRYWDNKIKTLEFIDLEDVLNSKYLEQFETDDSIDKLYEFIIADEPDSIEKPQLGFTPWPNQIEASEKWFINKSGILGMATGERVIIVTGCSFYCSIKGFRNFKQLYFVHCLE